MQGFNIKYHQNTVVTLMLLGKYTVMLLDTDINKWINWWHCLHLEQF